tara:strand:- start:1052 stop:1696 length:645 start_codon:yes stop_codon:yes gene_type:complete
MISSNNTTLYKTMISSNNYNIIESILYDIIDTINIKSKIINKGTGAGGSNTNKNGLPYEEITDLKTNYNVFEKNSYYNLIKFNNSETEFKMTKQSKLFKCMHHNINHNIVKAHGCKNPDECFIDENKKNIFIIEKKFQQIGGSVCEKIQTPDFKIWQYSRTFPKYNIVYIYCLSEWFKENCKSELEYLTYKNVPVFWGNDEEYKTKITNFIINY